MRIKLHNSVVEIVDDECWFLNSNPYFRREFSKGTWEINSRKEPGVYLYHCPKYYISRVSRERDKVVSHTQDIKK